MATMVHVKRTSISPPIVLLMSLTNNPGESVKARMESWLWEGTDTRKGCRVATDVGDSRGWEVVRLLLIFLLITTSL